MRIVAVKGWQRKRKGGERVQAEDVVAKRPAPHARAATTLLEEAWREVSAETRRTRDGMSLQMTRGVVL